MSKYHKIQSVFKRDPENNFKTFLEGEYSLPEFEYLADNDWVFTEKIDGTNIRVYYNGTDRVVWFEGRTDKAQIPTFLLEQLVEMFPPEVFSMFDASAGTVVLYGEGYGARIQKGGGNYISDGVSFVLFDVRIGNWWLERSAVDDLAESLGIKSVPVRGFSGPGTLKDMVDFVRGGFESSWGPFEAEGLVARPAVELSARNGKRIITKLKCRDFK